MAEGDVLYEVKGRIAVITMNRPERMNALSIGMREELQKAWRRFADSDNEWVAILTGAGDKAFCAGMDLKEYRELQEKDIPWEAQAHVHGGTYDPLGLEIFKPTIAAVNGFAVAGGWLMAQNCHLCVASEDAEFGIAEARWNMGGPWVAPLTHQISLRHAVEVVALATRRISAQRAYEIGFVNWVVPKEKVMDKALEVAELILENAPAAVRSFIEIFYRTYNLDHHQGLEVARHIQKHLPTMQDSIEGGKSFVEKRKPVFQNK